MKIATLNLVEQRDSKCNEAINILRSSIEFAERKRKVLALVGCKEPDGTWKIAINLASSFAKLGKKTLFIDTNLRDAKLKRFYKTEIGLAEYLQGKASLETVLCATTMEQLDVILAGNFPNMPSELIAGERFEQLIHSLRDQYDYIIMNTSPLEKQIDGVIVARLSDAVIPVIEYNKTKYKQAEEMKVKLERSGCEIFGCIFNQLSSPKRSIMRLL